MSTSAASPRMLLPPPPKRGKGVRRLNSMPVYIAAGGLLAVVLVVAYSYQQRINRQQAEAAASDANNQTKGAAEHAQDVIKTAAPDHATTPPSAYAGRPYPQPDPARSQALAAAPADIAGEARARAWAAYYQQQAQIDQARAEAAGKALSADSDAGLGNNGGSGLPGGGPSIVAGASGAASLPPAGVDSSAQAEKRAFLAQGGDPLGLNEDLPAVLHGPKWDAIMAGTAIPATMVGGMTSDQPGMVIGEISETVYDTATGDHVLIPQGTRVIGTYDNSVSNGQERVGVIWSRLIFPDSSSLQLGAMEGADQGGYAGFHDQVNEHWLKKFLSATLISIGGAAAQLSQPQQSAFSGYSSTSTATGALSQQYAQLAQEQARAGLSIPNTLEIRPGYSFRILVNKDLHLPDYVDHRGAVARSAAGPILQ